MIVTKKELFTQVDGLKTRINSLNDYADNINRDNSKLDAQLQALADVVKGLTKEMTEELSNAREQLANELSSVRDQQIRLECLKLTKDMVLNGNIAGDVQIEDFANNLVSYVKGNNAKKEDDAI